MTQYVEKVGAPSFQAVVASSSSAEGPDLSDRRRAQAEAENLARYRLIIEGEPDTGFVYRSVDRVTGEVVSEFPRESVLKLMGDPDYAQGSVIDTTA